MKLKKKVFIIFICLLFSVNYIFSQNKDIIVSNNLNFDLIKEIDEIIENVLKSSKVPGISISITNSEEIIFAKGYGVSDISKKDNPMTIHTKLKIGSITKSFTSLALLQLVQEGKICLTDKVIDHIPDFKTYDAEKSNLITIEMLINNTSGLPLNSISNVWEINTTDINYNNIIKTLNSAELIFEPGTAFYYSNDGFVLCALIMEKIEKKPYHEIIEDRILKPLKMMNSTTNIDKIKSIEFLSGHRASINTYLSAEKSYMGLHIPAGSEFISTAYDLSKYMQLFLNEGFYEENIILEKDFFNHYYGKNAKRSQPFDMYEVKTTYGNGWFYIDNSPFFLHGGTTATASSALIIDTNLNIGIIILYNVDDVKNENLNAVSTATKIIGVLNKYFDKNFDDNFPEIISNGINYKPLLSKNTEFIEHSKDIIGKYVSSSGLTNLKIELNEKNNLIGILYNSHGKTEYKLNMISTMRGYMENLSTESYFNLLLGNTGIILGFYHPLYGLMLKERVELYSNYIFFYNTDFSFAYKKNLILKEENSGKKITLFCDRDYYKITIEIHNQKENYFEIRDIEHIIFETKIRDYVINNKNINEKIWVYKDSKNDNLISTLKIVIKNDYCVTIELESKFDMLSKIRNEDIKELINSLFIN